MKSNHREKLGKKKNTRQSVSFLSLRGEGKGNKEAYESSYLKILNFQMKFEDSWEKG